MLGGNRNSFQDRIVDSIRRCYSRQCEVELVMGERRPNADARDGLALRIVNAITAVAWMRSCPLFELMLRSISWMHGRGGIREWEQVLYLRP